MDICSKCGKNFKRMREGSTDEDSGKFEDNCDKCFWGNDPPEEMID